jgi:hypothetical protein
MTGRLCIILACTDSRTALLLRRGEIGIGPYTRRGIDRLAAAQRKFTSVAASGCPLP